jgi:DNA-binding FadR family transcriptional regulator
MGIMKVRPRVGTFVANDPIRLGKSSLEWMVTLGGLQAWHLSEVRHVLEISSDVTAAQRGRTEHFMALSDEITNMYTTLK